MRAVRRNNLGVGVMDYRVSLVESDLSLKILFLLVEDIKLQLQSVNHSIYFLLPQFHIFQLELLAYLSLF